MISFKQLCECLTINQLKAWFWFDKEYYDCLTEEEKTLIFAELTLVSNYKTNKSETILYKCWYPTNKFRNHHKDDSLWCQKDDEPVFIDNKEPKIELPSLSYDERIAQLKEQYKDLPSLQTLREQRIAASIKDDISSVRKIDELITIRCRINAYENSRRVDKKD